MIISLTIIIWCILLTMFTCIPLLYYFYMKTYSSRPWNVVKDGTYQPLVSILVPVYNEEKIIRFKIENLMKLKYPKEKLQVIIVNDGSTDKTMHEISLLKSETSSMQIILLDSGQRQGKCNSMNLALKHATGEIIVVSDADCFWQQETLLKFLPYLSDPKVGAVTGLEVLLNTSESWITESELLYNNIVHAIRVGESKVYSTIFFQGGLGAYKRSMLEQFDEVADDSGSALNIVQQGARTLLVPEAIYYTTFPSTWRGKISTKLRRATQLLRLLFKCMRLLIQGELRLPKRIFIPEYYQYVMNPFIFVLLIIYSLLVVFENPILFPLLLFSLIGCMIVRRSRTFMIEVAQEHFILLGAIISLAFNRDFTSWSTSEVSRNLINREMLQRHGLV